jgi:hypothetical protein
VTAGETALNSEPLRGYFAAMQTHRIPSGPAGGAPPAGGLKGASMNIRAKFRCDAVVQAVGQETVNLYAVSGDSAENKQWSLYTPSGQLSLTITNRDVFGAFVPGREYFLTIEAAK